MTAVCFLSYRTTLSGRWREGGFQSSKDGSVIDEALGVQPGRNWMRVLTGFPGRLR